MVTTASLVRRIYSKGKVGKRETKLANCLSSVRLTREGFVKFQRDFPSVGESNVYLFTDVIVRDIRRLGFDCEVVRSEHIKPSGIKQYHSFIAIIQIGELQ